MARTPLVELAGTVDLSRVDATALVVDDDEDLADTYALWLEDWLDVHTAYDGETALDALEAYDVDVVLLDRRMPRMSGDEVLEEIHESEYDPGVSLVTAVEPSVDVVDLPFHDYLVKPVDRDAMLSTVQNLLALDVHDDAIREYYSLRSKIDAIEAGSEYREDDVPQEVRDLRQRIADLRTTARDGNDDLVFEDGRDDDAGTAVETESSAGDSLQEGVVSSESSDDESLFDDR